MTAHGGPGRRSVRAVLTDDHGRLLLLRRTRPGEVPYWTAPGGGVETGDASDEAALRRELVEELGATVGVVRPVLTSDETGDVQVFFACRVRAIDPAARCGPELDDPSRGAYDLDRFAPGDARLAGLDVRPEALRRLLLATRWWEPG